MIRFRCNIVPPTATAQQKGVFVRGGRAHFFEKASVRSAREILTAAFRPYVPDEPISTPVSVYIRWEFPYRASEKKSITKLGLVIPHITRPDLDNIEKQVLDVLTTMRFWTDDSLVWSKTTLKMRGPNPGIDIQISEE